MLLAYLSGLHQANPSSILRQRVLPSGLTFGFILKAMRAFMFEPAPQSWAASLLAPFEIVPIHRFRGPPTWKDGSMEPSAVAVHIPGGHLACSLTVARSAET